MSASRPNDQDKKIWLQWEEKYTAGVFDPAAAHANALMIQSYLHKNCGDLVTSESLDKAVVALRDALLWKKKPVAPPERPKQMYQMGDRNENTNRKRQENKAEADAELMREMNDPTTQTFKIANRLAENKVEYIRDNYCVSAPSGKLDHGRTQERRELLKGIIAWMPTPDEKGERVRNYISELRFIEEKAIPAFEREDARRGQA